MPRLTSRSRTVTLIYADGRRETFAGVVGDIQGHHTLTGFRVMTPAGPTVILRVDVVRMEVA